MGQAHGDRLTAVDASFLAQETSTSHMHIGAVTIFEGTAPAYADVAAHIRSRLHLVPRYRQRLAVPPLETGRPLWVDDASFNLDYHLRHTALPAPGTEDQLRAMAARIVSQPLDRERPLWEMWLVEGLQDGRFPLITKTHHALVDGVSVVDLATVIFDLAPEGTPAGHPQREWTPAPPPSRLDMAVRGVRGAVKAPLEIATKAVGAAARPTEAVEAAREAAEGLGEIM